MSETAKIVVPVRDEPPIGSGKTGYEGAPTLVCGACYHEWIPRVEIPARKAPFRCPKCQKYLDTEAIPDGQKGGGENTPTGR